MKYNRFMGEYDDNTIYQAGDVVNFDGASYYRKVPGKGISPIARKKPYTVWSRLNEALSTIFPLGGTGGGGASLPAAAPYQQLVTDGEGNWVAEERLAWKTLQKGSELIPETNLSFTASSGMMAGDAPLDTLLVAGEKYVVNWDGKEYVSTCQTASEGFPILGNYSLYDPAMDNTGEPFCAVQLFTLIFYTQDEAATHTVGLSAMSEAVRTVPPEYLPEGIGYKEKSETVILPEKTGVVANDGEYAWLENITLSDVNGTLAVGDTLVVLWNGKPYECVVQYQDGYEGVDSNLQFGAVDGSVSDGVYPFYAAYEFYEENDGRFQFLLNVEDTSAGTEIVVSVIKKETTLHPIPDEYINKWDAVIEMRAGSGIKPAEYPNAEDFTLAEGTFDDLMAKVSAGKCVQVYLRCFDDYFDPPHPWMYVANTVWDATYSDPVIGLRFHIPFSQSNTTPFVDITLTPDGVTSVTRGIGVA